MKATRIGAARNADGSLWPRARTVGRLLAYLGVPAATLTAYPGVFVTVNVLTSFYLVAIFGVVALFRGAKISRGLLNVCWFLAGWYLVLLAIELFHGGPFHYPPTPGGNYLTDYFPLLALPFFVVGLRETKVDLRVFERVMMATIVFSAGVCVYQYLVLGVDRPGAFSRNPIPLALVVMVWSLFVLSRALQARKIDWIAVSVGLVGLIPIALSGSKNVWVCTVVGYFALLLIWAQGAQRKSAVALLAVALVPLAWLLSRTVFVQTRIAGFVGDFGAFLVSGDTSGGSFGLRLAVIVSGFRAFLDRPFFGYGLVHGKIAAMEHRPPNFSSIAGLKHLHNEYVTHLVAFGIPGLIFIFSFLALFILLAARREDNAVRRFGVVVGSVLVVYLMADVMFTLPEVYGVVFFALGLILFSSEKTPTAAETPASADPPLELTASPAPVRTGEASAP